MSTMADHEAILRTLLHSIALEHNYQDHDLTINHINKRGVSYTSKLFLATISAKDKDDLKIFAKVAILGQTLRKQVSIRLFETEQFVYRKLKNIYEGIQEKHAVPTEHKLVFPKFYGYNDKELQETIVLEDLTARGFTTYNRFESIDWAYASKAVEEMAKLHALSIAHATESPDEFEAFIKNYRFDPKEDMDQLNPYWKTLLNLAVKAASKENARMLEEHYAGARGEVAYVDMRKTLRRPILAHSDFRPSNLMHKVHEDGTVEVIVVDYQTMQAGCPAADLLFFIMMGSDSAFRSQHQEKLKEHYYQHLRAALKRLDLDPDEAYSRENFDYECKEMLPIALTMAIFYLPTATVEEKDAPVIDHNTVLNGFAVGKTSELFAKRINELVEDYQKWGILQKPSHKS